MSKGECLTLMYRTVMHSTPFLAGPIRNSSFPQALSADRKTGPRILQANPPPRMQSQKTPNPSRKNCVYQKRCARCVYSKFVSTKTVATFVTHAVTCWMRYRSSKAVRQSWTCIPAARILEVWLQQNGLWQLQPKVAQIRVLNNLQTRHWI